MRVLHTSDWHLGRRLHGQRRHAEFDAFLAWLVNTIRDEAVDCVLVAGDIFDTTTPGARAQDQYFGFLSAARAAGCRHIVVIAGNHDAPSLIDASRRPLADLGVHVVGTADPTGEREVITLCDGDGSAELIVAAVPFLRDADIRTVAAGESMGDKEAKLRAGIRAHYGLVAELAEAERGRLGGDVPVVGMGHLFTAGGRVTDDDGVKSLYVGTAAYVESSIFDATFDYVALGHLHVPQLVGGVDTVRYCGSPIPMGFGEVGQQKQVVIIDFDGATPAVSTIDIPVFQQLARVSGDLPAIGETLTALAAEAGDSSVWVEVEYTGDELVTGLNDRVAEMVADTVVEVLRVKNLRVMSNVLTPEADEESLDDLDEGEVFVRCLDTNEVPDSQRAELTATFEHARALLAAGGVQATGGDA